MRGTRLLLVGTIAAGLSGCDSLTPKDEVASVRFRTARASIEAGFTEQFVANAVDGKGATLTNKTIAWNSSAPGILTVSATGGVTALTAGTATVTASSDGKTADTVITVTPAIAREVVVTDAQFTQAVQAEDGSIPMIMDGLPAALNVLVECTPACAGRVPVVLRRTPPGGVAKIDTVFAAPLNTTSPSFGSPSAQFVVPAADLTTAPSWQVEADPAHRLTGDSVANNLFPRGGPITMTVTTVPPLKLRFIPVVLTAHFDRTPFITSAQFPDYAFSVKSMLPVGVMTMALGASLYTNSSFGVAPSGGAGPFWSQVLGEIDVARLAGGDPTEYWMGIVLPPSGFTYTAQSGVAYLGVSGSATGAHTRSSVVTQIGWLNNAEQGRNLTAHELGHNFSRRHAPCNNAPNPDPLFPDASGSIGVWGHNVFALTSGTVTTAASISPTTSDVMGYCTPAWISDYNYRAMLEFRGPAVIALRATDTTRRPVMVVRGSVDAAGAITIEPALAMTARASLPDRGGRYRARGLSAAGSALFDFAFEPVSIEHLDAKSFLFAIPDDGAINASLDRIEVSGPGRMAVMQRQFAAMTTADTTSLRWDGAGMGEAQCARSGRSVVVQDIATGAVLGIGRGPRVRFRSPRSARIAVTCSDGVRSIRRVY